MKRYIKLLTLVLGLLLIICIGSITVKADSEEYKANIEGVDYNLVLNDDMTFTLNDIEGTYTIVNGYYNLYLADVFYKAVGLNKAFGSFSLYDDEQVLEENDTEIKTVIIEKINTAKDWIVAVLVSFISVGSLGGIALAIVKGIAASATMKIKLLEEQAQISKENASKAIDKVNELEHKATTDLVPKLEKAIDLIEEYIGVDKEKQAKATEILKSLNDIKVTNNEEQGNKEAN